ncbi:MAG: ABC transporter permease [Candidatus Acidiferrum sp.]|jgi:predicted permease
MKNMRWLRRIWQKPLVEKRLDSELQFHLEQQIADYIAAGMTREEAQRRANLEFGGVERFKEECREARWENHLELLYRDLQSTLRGLRKDPRFTIVAVMALALGIGASTAMFSVLYNALVAPFPYKDQGRLVTLRIRDLDRRGSSEDDGDFRGLMRYRELLEYKQQNHVFDALVANCEFDVVYDSGGNNSFMAANYVTPGTFEMYGVEPLIGRGLEPVDYEPGAPLVFVLRYAAWTDEFGSDPNAVGKMFRLNGVSRTLVGVMPPRFAWGGASLWMPRDPALTEVVRGDFPAYWGVIAHLKPGVTLEEAEADLNVIGGRIAPNFREDYPQHFRVIPEFFVHAVIYSGFRRTLYVLFAAVGLLLLIGCANVANLLLARATTRGKEFAVRAALGASRARLIRQLLLESTLLAVGGAIFGVLFAWGGIRALSVSMPAFTIPSETVIEMNIWVLLFGIGLAFATVIIFGLFPAFQASHVDVQDALRDSGKGLGGTAAKSRMRNVVIMVEVALSLILLFTASLFMRSFVAIQHVSLGWQPDHLVTGRLPLPRQRHKTGRDVTTFFQPLLLRLKSTPGIALASPVTTTPPYGGFGGKIEIPGKTHSDTWESLIQLVGEDYFSVVRQPLVSGRMFTEAEVSDAQKVVVINQTFQRRFLDHGDPIGRTIVLDALKDLPDPVQEPSFRIVGVAADAKNVGLERAPEPEVWVPYSVTGSLMRRLLVRTELPPSAMVATVRKAVWAADPDVAFAEGGSLSDTLDTFSYAQPRLGFFLVATFATIGLVLVTLGVYSVIAYATSRRTHEIGIRMALGAAGTDVLGMILKDGLGLLIPGIVVGIAASFAISRVVVTTLLWGVSPYDPLTAFAVVVLLLLIGLLACWIPARRATRVDPVTALHYE